MARSLVVAVALVVAFPVSASANLLWPCRSMQTVAYYYVVPVVCVSPRPVCVVAPSAVPAAPLHMPKLLATPAPAGPSTTAEPPLAPSDKPIPPPPTGQPGVRESRYYDSYTVASSAGKADAERCSVAFWNLTNRDMTVKVAGRNHVLPSRRNLTLDVEREFAWQLEGRESESAKVPATESGLEIVIRQ